MKRLLRVLAVALLFTGVLAACGDDDGGDDGNTADAASTADASSTADAATPDAAAACDILACEGTTGRTCDDEPLIVECSEFGATCADFTDQEDQPFQFCDCGDLGEFEGICLDGQFGIVCTDGLGGLSDCGPGMLCAEAADEDVAIDCVCDNAADDLCPTPSCTDDPDCEPV